MKMKLNEKAILTLSSGILAGLGTTLSLVGVPSIKATSDPLPVWRQCYKNGKNIALSAIAVSTISGIRLFFEKEDWSYLIPVGLTVTFVPYTLLLMKPTNDALHAIGDGEKQAQDGRIRQLVEKWEKLQWVRTTLGVGAFLAVIIIIHK